MISDPTYTTPADFLGNQATITLPSGKVIYAYEIGAYHLQLTQAASVEWTIYNPATGDVIQTNTFDAGSTTYPITNSFINKYLMKAYVEIDGYLSGGVLVPATRPDLPNQLTARAELNRINFDLTPLESLPSADQEYKVAVNKSNDANLAIKAANGNWLDKFFYSIFGVSTTTGLLVTAGGIVAYKKLK